MKFTEQVSLLGRRFFLCEIVSLNYKKNKNKYSNFTNLILRRFCFLLPLYLEHCNVEQKVHTAIKGSRFNPLL